MVVVLLIPVFLILGAWYLAAQSVRRSELSITSEGVDIRNYRRPPRLVPLAQVDHFEEHVATGNFHSLRPKTCVLVLTDGSRLAVRALTAPEAGVGVAALNQRVESLRAHG